MQSLDLLGLQRDRRIAPTEADIRMMAFSFREFANLLNKGKCLPEIAKPKAPLDAVSFLLQLPVWSLCVQALSLLAREWRYSPATGSAGFASKSFGHVKKIVDDAKALEKAGAFAILLELVPDRLCKLITERSENCIIMGLGSGPGAHGQLLIYHDMFGLYPKFKPKMAKVFGNAGEVILNGLKQYASEVTAKTFPQLENWFGMSNDEYDDLLKML
jgi:hypothetical protein